MPSINKNRFLKKDNNNGGMKPLDTAALDCALNVKGYITATKYKNKKLYKEYSLQQLHLCL
jgi:hypothetical protein